MFEEGHSRVCHKEGQYARGPVHVNTCESFFSLLKRKLYGAHHSVSKRHLHRYASEQEFIWNNRECDDGERTRRAIKKADGKRLRYKDPA